MPALHLARFACDVTPPLGHPLCGGWIEPVRDVVDPLWARGVVLLGMGQPIVLCALDWCELRNEANDRWREILAEAAHTTADCVAVQCLHQHDAPIGDLEAQRLLAKTPGAPPMLDLAFFESVAHKTAEALRTSLAESQRFDAIGTGQAKVEKVASNRRVLGPDGRVAHVRYSATTDPATRDAPEGLVDPMLKTLSFWRGDRPLAALHYYATHPMSHYGAGHVSSDFCGLARQKRQNDDPAIFQVYFTGCAGNITAGKYNDGSPENRPVLRDRIYAAMKAAWENMTRNEVSRWEWHTEPLKFQARTEATFGAEESRQRLANEKEAKARRGNAAIQLAWLARIERPILLSCLNFERAAIVHLPGEPFIEYQLHAQALRPDAFVCVAGYGDGGPGYIPTTKAYEEGGYEPTVALASPECEATLKEAMTRLLDRKNH